MSVITREDVYDLLREVLDPEVPVLDVVSMGIVRDVSVTGEVVVVTITPTYSGCPAMNMIERLIIEKLRSSGIDDPKVITVLSPAWTTEWMTDEAREKLRAYGIAPPGRGRSGDVPRSVACPFCGSAETELKSAFGSTACKALYVCSSCRQPFEHFKCI